MEERTTPAIYRGVRDGLADVGIASEFTSHEGLQVFPYRRYALAPCCRPATPWSMRSNWSMRSCWPTTWWS